MVALAGKDFEVARWQEARIGKRFHTEAIERVRAVGDQLSKKDVFLGIERMNHQVQQLLNFCRKGMLFCAHFYCRAG